MITYTLDKPSGIEINGAELKKGDVVKEPQSLIKRLLARDGWELVANQQKTPTKKQRSAKKDVE